MTGGGQAHPMEDVPAVRLRHHERSAAGAEHASRHEKYLESRSLFGCRTGNLNGQYRG